MRPVPLEHFLWAGRDLHKIVDSKSKFLGDGSVVNVLQEYLSTDVQVQVRD
jgi:antiviral helicase SKI2